MQACKFRIISKGQVQMHALQIGPAMASTVKNLIKGFVDCTEVVWPQSHFAEGVHPRMHGRRHQSATEGSQLLVDPANFSVKSPGQSMQRIHRCTGLQFHHMQHQFIRP